MTGRAVVLRKRLLVMPRVMHKVIQTRAPVVEMGGSVSRPSRRIAKRRVKRILLSRQTGRELSEKLLAGSRTLVFSIRLQRYACGGR